MYLERHGKKIAVALMLLCAAPLTTTVFAMEKDIQPNWVGDKSPAAISAKTIAASNLKKDIKKNIQFLSEEEAKAEKEKMKKQARTIEKEREIEVANIQKPEEPVFTPVEVVKPAPKPTPAPEVELESKPVPKPEPAPEPSVDINARIAAEAQKLVGVTDGWQCTEVATQALVNSGISIPVLWPDQYITYGHAVDFSQAQPGNLIYYYNGGRGIDHIAIYIGNGLAVHGNYNGRTVIESIYPLGCGSLQFIQVAY